MKWCDEHGIEPRKAYLWKIIMDRETESNSLMKRREFSVKINNIRLYNYNDTCRYFIKLFWGYTQILRKKFVGKMYDNFVER